MKKIAAICRCTGKVCLIFYLVQTIAFSGSAQSPRPVYHSLLWEISGNGMEKPSYLFGSMHVSSKTVFHLSDSFYTAIASCEMVALELDPVKWQPDSYRLGAAHDIIGSYYSLAAYNYLRPNDFRLKDYAGFLPSALREAPADINGLLYRTNPMLADYEENTYLDLYVYQTGRRLGLKGTGVETLPESERLLEEANLAFMKEKVQPRNYPPGENMFTFPAKLEEAYRHGDLDLLDSLNDMMALSRTFTEIFLYSRDDIQARAIDSIIRHHTLFVAVGAAHLPGSHGIIENLRRRGYTVRPVQMADQDAPRREEIDKIHVPVETRTVTTDDGLIECSLPGAWFLRNGTLFGGSLQYADMDNGSYYMLTRVRTDAALRGEPAEKVMKRIDSLLYDNIPGKVLSQQRITRDGYPGFDVTNKTREGDIQRYMILVTPMEVLIFKMSGKEDYVSGKEGENFFRSIRLKTPALPASPASQWVDYTPPSGGFRAVFPQAPRVSEIKPSFRMGGNSNDWYFDACSASGDAYVIHKRNIFNKLFIEEDTFDLSLVEESLIRDSASIGRELQRKFGQADGHDCLDMVFASKTGNRLKARAIIRGADYYLLLASGKDEKGQARFFSGFHLDAYHYGPASIYQDSAAHYSVSSPVRPDLPADFSFMGDITMQLRYATHGQPQLASPFEYSFRQLKNDSTGESIAIAVRQTPPYYYQKDSAAFWESEDNWKRLTAGFIIAQKEFFRQGDSVCGYRYTLQDTNTNRQLVGMVQVKGRWIYTLVAETDRLGQSSDFIRDVFASFTPSEPYDSTSVFTDNARLFFRQYHSKDSAIRKAAHAALSQMQFEANDLPELEKTIERLNPNGRTYTEAKIRLIHAMGRIRDTTCLDSVVSYLKGLYTRLGDSSAIQNAVVQAMADIRRKDAYLQVRDWLIQKPPVFETDAELLTIFRHLGEDTLLAPLLFPDILQLASIEDYKTPVFDLLYHLADSNHLPKESYSVFFPALLAEGQLLLKKRQITDEKEATGNEGARNNTDTRLRLIRYARLLAVFYDRPSVPAFFNQLLRTGNMTLRLETAVLLIGRQLPVPDSVLLSLAASDRHRATLYRQLDKIGRLDLFPAQYKNQEAMARAVIIYSFGAMPPVAVEAAGKKWVITRDRRGYAYFFKYKMTDNGPWMMGFSGLQPEKPSEVNADRYLERHLARQLLPGKPEQQQFEEGLRSLLLAKRRSAIEFANLPADLPQIPRLAFQ